MPVQVVTSGILIKLCQCTIIIFSETLSLIVWSYFMNARTMMGDIHKQCLIYVNKILCLYIIIYWWISKDTLKILYNDKQKVEQFILPVRLISWQQK